MAIGEIATAMARSGVWRRPAPTPAVQDNRLGARLSPAALAAFSAYLALVGVAWWSVLHLVPGRLSLTLLGHAFSVGDLHRRILQHGSILVLIVPGVFFIELAFVGWAGSSARHLLVRRAPSSLSDLACFLLWQTPLMPLLIAGTSFGVVLVSGAWLHDRIAAVTGLNLSVAGLPTAVQVAVFFGVFTFLDYWNHRLDHSRLFWPLHRFHHAADEFSVINSVRTHPAAFTGVISTTLPAVLFSASPDVIADVNLFVIALRYMIHSRINSDFGLIGRYILQSPVHHRLHHVLDMSERTGHFGVMPLWDHLFGTWRPDAAATDQSLVIGVQTPYRQGLWIVPDLWRDYADFWKALFGAGRLTVR